MKSTALSTILVSVAVLFSLASLPVYAAPFVVSDPYPPTVRQPTEFIVKFKGTGKQVVVPATQTDAGVILKWDIAEIVGTHTITAVARDEEGESEDSAPFTFIAGDLSAPSGLTLSAQ